MHKIAVIGTFGVGKTTFLHRLFSELKYRAFQVEMVPELSRLCPYDINERGSVTRGQYWIMREQIRMELERVESLPDFLLCDRSVFDNTIFAERGAEKGYVDSRIYELIRSATRAWETTYSLLVFIRLEDHLRLSRNRGMADGVRSDNEEFQVDIERRLERSWRDYPGKKIEIGGNLDRRTGLVMAFLREMIGDSRLRDQDLGING